MDSALNSAIYQVYETLAEKEILLKYSLVDDWPFGRFDQLMPSQYGFTVKSHRIEIYGYCQDRMQRPEEIVQESDPPQGSGIVLMSLPFRLLNNFSVYRRHGLSVWTACICRKMRNYAIPLDKSFRQSYSICK